MTAAAVAGPVELPEHTGPPGRPTVETQNADIVLGGGAVRPATTGIDDPRIELDTLADREGAK